MLDTGKPEAASASVADCVSEYKWRDDHKRGVREYVRVSDGFVLERRKLKPSKTTSPKGETMPRKTIDMLGMESGKLTVIGDSDRTGASGQRYVRVRCECGVEKEVDAQTIKKRTAKSCGCSKGRKATTSLVKLEKQAVAPVVEKKKQAEIVHQIQPEIDLKSTADVIDAIVTLCEQVEVGHAERLVEEIERMMSFESPLLPKNMTRYHQTAIAFLELRQKLASVE